MRIYTPVAPEGAEWVTLDDGDSDKWEVLFALAGPAIGWLAPRMSFIRQKDDGTRRCYADCPWCVHTILVFRSRALSLVQPVLGAAGEFLAAKCDEPVTLFNPTTIIDALDDEKSVVARFDSGEILAIERHAFKPDLVADAEIFKLPGRASNIYLRETAVRQLDRLSLAGLAFDMVWTDEGN